MRQFEGTLLLGLSVSILSGCSLTTVIETANSPAVIDHDNPAPSDSQAEAIAARVRQALGGRTAWDNTRYLTFNFFGRRQHLWDKQTGDVRIEYTDAKQQKTIYLFNVNTRQGRVHTETRGETADPQLLERGYSDWVNDTYWLLMPYKLEDTGVTLKDLGEGQTRSGREAQILQLTFEEVGITPLNKYHVYVNKETNLVEQWDFFMTAEDEEPRLSTPWSNWQEYGPADSRIKLASGRGGERTFSEINVLTAVPENAFTSFDPIDWQALAPNAADDP